MNPREQTPIPVDLFRLVPGRSYSEHVDELARAVRWGNMLLGRWTDQEESAIRARVGTPDQRRKLAAAVTRASWAFNVRRVVS